MVVERILAHLGRIRWNNRMYHRIPMALQEREDAIGRDLFQSLDLHKFHVDLRCKIHVSVLPSEKGKTFDISVATPHTWDMVQLDVFWKFRSLEELTSYILPQSVVLRCQTQGVHLWVETLHQFLLWKSVTSGTWITGTSDSTVQKNTKPFGLVLQIWGFARRWEVQVLPCSWTGLSDVGCVA